MERIYLYDLIQIQKSHLAGSINTAGDFFFGQKLKITGKIWLKIRGDGQKTSKKTSALTDGEQIFCRQENNKEKTKETDHLETDLREKKRVSSCCGKLCESWRTSRFEN